MQREQPDTAVIPQRDVHAAASPFAFVTVRAPIGVKLHPERLPHDILEIGRQVVTDCGAHDRTYQIGFGRAVVKFLSGRRDPRFCSEITLNVDHPIRGISGHIRIQIRVVFIPFDAGCHLQHIADLYCVIRRAAQPRQVVRNRIINAVDIALLNGCAQQHRGDRFGDRKGNPECFFMIAEAVALQQQLTIFNYQQTSGVIFHHVVIQRETLAIDLVGKVRPVEVLFRQFESVVPAANLPHRIKAIPIAKTHNLRVTPVCQNMTAEGQQPFIVGRINISRRLGTDDRSHTQADGQKAQYTG